MAVLIFGVAAAPVFSGTVFAQSEEQKYTEKEKKEQRSDDSKERKVQQNVQDNERKQASDAKQKEHSEKKEQNPSDAKGKLTAAQQLQEQRREALKEKQQISKEQRDNQERIDRERMQQRLDKLNDRSPMAEALDRLNKANSQCGPGTIFDSASNACVLVEVDSSDASTNNAQYFGTVDRSNVREPLSNEQDTTEGYFDKLRKTIAEQKKQQGLLFTQITTLLNLVDSMCEDKVIVAGVSDGALRCIDSDRAFNMQARGLVTIVR